MPEHSHDRAAPGEPDDGFVTGEPVPGFPIRFRWHTGVWRALFDKQIALLERDIARARAEDFLLVFQSSPLSGRGGGHYSTNVEIADHTARRLGEEWGHRFWILNPARYQMESREGTGLMVRHAAELSRETGDEIDVERLFRESPPVGGDYMRMWTRILVEDGDGDLGRRWDAMYFIGPADARDFFAESGSGTWSAGVEDYFARQITMNREFHDTFTPPFDGPDGERLEGDEERAEWARRRHAFLRYYTLRAGVVFSLGSHDEWNIWRLLNERRRAQGREALGDQIAGFFEGRQLDPAAVAAPVPPGYAADADANR